jgi:hypothetical protein
MLTVKGLWWQSHMTGGGGNERFNEIKEMFKMDGSKLRNKLAYEYSSYRISYLCVCVLQLQGWNNNRALLREKENTFNTLEHYGNYMYHVLMSSLQFLQ